LAILLGALVLLGWHVGSPTLVQVRPALVPMQYNTALGIALCGAMVLAFTNGWRRAALASAAAAAALGVLSGLQYPLAVDLGIDELFMDAYITVGTTYPGRMAPATAVGLAIAGLGLIASTRLARSVQGLALAFAGSLVLALGLGTFIGYLGETDTPYGWIHLAYMAVHTALGFTVIGVGMVAGAWEAETAGRGGVPRWVTIPVATTLVMLAVVLWQSILADERIQLAASVERQALVVSSGIGDAVNPLDLAMARMGRRWSRRGGMPAEEWSADAGAYLDDQPGVSAILSVDAEYRLRGMVPAAESSTALGADLAPNEQRRAQLDEMRDRGETTVTPSFGAERRTFFIVVPVAREGAFDGFLIGVVSIDGVLERIREAVRGAGYAFTVFENGTEVFSLPEAERLHEAEWGHEAEIDVGELDWRLRLWPSSSRVDVAQTTLPGAALIGGLLGAALLTATVGLAQVASERSSRIEAMNRELVAEVADRERAEAQLRDLARTLEVKVEQRTREVARRNELLLRANEDLKQFAYVASHDLQEPLRMVASYLQLIEKRYGDKLDHDGREFIDFAVDGATRMKQLINDLLQYSRVESQGTRLEPTDLDAVLSQSLQNLKVAIDEAGATITSDPLPTVRGDATQLTMLFQNLVGNAIKFHGDAPPEVHVGAEADGDGHRLWVRDKGIGIEPRYADRIFVIFQRLHGKSAYPGTGIGLAVCKRIVERHGGEIWVESTPGGGSTFFFTLGGGQGADDDVTNITG
jgi:signal transduction histidine kinase